MRVFIIIFYISSVAFAQNTQERAQKIIQTIKDDQKYYMQDNYFNYGEVEVDSQNVITEYHVAKTRALGRVTPIATITGANLKKICLPVYDTYSSATSIGYCSFELQGKSYKVPMAFEQNGKLMPIRHPTEIRMYTQNPDGTAPKNSTEVRSAVPQNSAIQPQVAPKKTEPITSQRSTQPERPVQQAVAQSNLQVSPTVENRNASENAFDSYIYSQLPCESDKNKYSTFTQNYGADLKKSAEIFQMPESYLKCLIFKESKFVVDAQSGTGARGLGQILRVASNEGMRFYIEGLRITDQQYQAIQNQIKSLRAQLASSTNPSQIKKQLENLIIQEGFYKVSRAWKAYGEHLAKTGKIKKKYSTAPSYATNYLKRSKMQLSAEDIRNLNLFTEVNDPPVAVGIAGMYLKTIHHKYDIENNDTQVTQLNYKKFIVDAGAYNAGDATLDRAQVHCAAKLGRELGFESKYVDCLYTYFKSNNLQTSSYTQSIENCLRSQIGKVDSGYLNDIKGTNIPDDELSLNQTESACFIYGGQLINHNFADMFSCNDITKIKGLYGKQSAENNSCNKQLPANASEDLKYVDRLFKNRGLPKESAVQSIIHRIGTDDVCVKKNGKNTVDVSCKVGRCPGGYVASKGFYATLSAPDRYFQCRPRSRPGGSRSGGKGKG